MHRLVQFVFAINGDNYSISLLHNVDIDECKGPERYPCHGKCKKCPGTTHGIAHLECMAMLKSFAIFLLGSDLFRVILYMSAHHTLDGSYSIDSFLIIQ